MALKAADHGNRILFKGEKKKDRINLFAKEAPISHHFHISQLRTVNTCPVSGQERVDFCSTWNGARLWPRGYSIPSHVVAGDGEKGLYSREKWFLLVE